MWYETAQLYLDPDTETDESLIRRTLLTLPGLQHMNLGRNHEGSWWAGDFTVDLFFSDGICRRDVTDHLAQLPGVARLDHVTYQRIGGGQRAPDLKDGIWRTLLLRVRPEQDPALVTALERDLLRMPAYMPGIRNWQLGRVCSDSNWTHVWQQEYSRLDDLQGEYLTHPYHWGWVDRWFDPEFPEWTVEAISHAFCPLETSILTHPLSSVDARHGDGYVPSVK